MSTSQGFCEFLIDQLSALSGVSLRRMFGGAGIYRDGVMFGLIAEDVFYLKADDTNRRDFEAVHMGPFIYESKDGKQMAMQYYQVPTDVLEDRERLATWARTAHKVATAQKSAQPQSKRKPAAPAKAPAKKATATPRKKSPAKSPKKTLH